MTVVDKTARLLERHLLGEFDVVGPHGRVEVPPAAARVVAYLAIQGSPRPADHRRRGDLARRRRGPRQSQPTLDRVPAQRAGSGPRRNSDIARHRFGCHGRHRRPAGARPGHTPGVQSGANARHHGWRRSRRAHSEHDDAVYFASASAVIAQPVAAADTHWLAPYGKPLANAAWIGSARDSTNHEPSAICVRSRYSIPFRYARIDRADRAAFAQRDQRFAGRVGIGQLALVELRPAAIGALRRQEIARGVANDVAAAPSPTTARAAGTPAPPSWSPSPSSATDPRVQPTLRIQRAARAARTPEARAARPRSLRCRWTRSADGSSGSASGRRPTDAA